MTNTGVEQRFLDGTATQSDLEIYLSAQIDFEKLLGGNRLANTERDFQLAAFRSLLVELGSPHQAYPVIHVAGTKGKGSTCAMIASILQAHGLRVGQYASPHLERYTERIRVTNQEVPVSELGKILLRVRDQMSAGGKSKNRPDGWRTLFEQLTAAAFLYFQQQEVDVAVMETGLGGRLDATNVHDISGTFPVVSVITAIGLDHVAILGDTPYQIAGEKIAIVHSHCGAVLGPQPPAWADEVARAWSERLAFNHQYAGQSCALQVNVAEAVEVTELRATEWTESATFVIHDGLSDSSQGQVVIGLAGSHQVDNARTAVMAVRTLKHLMKVKSGGEESIAPIPPWTMNWDAVRTGLAGVNWPARIEVLDARRPVIIDGAHCPLSVRATMETIARHQSATACEEGFTVVMGLMMDKDIEAIVIGLRDGGAVFATEGNAHRQTVLIRRVIATQADWPRAMSADQLTTHIGRILGSVIPIHVEPDPVAAFRMALRDGGPVLGIGSLYLPASFRKAVMEN